MQVHLILPRPARIDVVPPVPTPRPLDSQDADANEEARDESVEAERRVLVQEENDLLRRHLQVLVRVPVQPLQPPRLPRLKQQKRNPDRIHAELQPCHRPARGFPRLVLPGSVPGARTVERDNGVVGALPDARGGERDEDGVREDVGQDVIVACELEPLLLDQLLEDRRRVERVDFMLHNHLQRAPPVR
eukprot:2786027-Rhodomonas_salina.2